METYRGLSETLVNRRQLGAFVISSLLTSACTTENNRQRVDTQPRVLTIDGEIKKLRDRGVMPDESEQRLFSKENFIPFIPGTVSNDQAEAILRPRLARLVDKMKQSKNPEFKTVSSDITQMIAERLLHINIVSNDQGNNRMAAGRVHNQDSGRIEYIITLFVNGMKDTNETMTALTLLHETKHIESYRTQDDLLLSQGEPPESVLRINRSKVLSGKGCIDEEAEAYALDVKAYIYQKALVPGLMIPEQEQKTAVFLRSGGQSSSPQWKSVMETITTCLK